MTEALALFSSGNLSPLALKEKLKEHGSSVENLRWEAVDVIVDYVELALEDNILSQEEMHTLRMMKLYFRVKEGDFLKQHKETQIEQIICRQLEFIYQDNQVNTQESLMKVDLQELFGLSYDQFLKFERKALEQALCNGADIVEKKQHIRRLLLISHHIYCFVLYFLQVIKNKSIQITVYFV